MANNKSFKIKNGLSATRYLQSAGADGAGSEGYSLAGASYDSKSFSVATQEISPSGIAFKTDGTKMYILGRDNPTTRLGGIINQYSLSTAWDVSTASYDSVNFDSYSQDSSPYSLYITSDGTTFYTMGNATDTVYQYSMSTAWDMSTASYSSKSFTVSSQATNPRGLVLNPTGTKLYVSDTASDAIYQYTLSTAFDVSTASYDSVSFSVASEDLNPYNMIFNSTGTRLVLLGISNDSLFQYSLSTAYDLSTASYDGVSFSLLSESTAFYSITFKPDGTKLYGIEYFTDSAFQYSTVSYTQTLDLSTGTSFSFTPSGATTVSFTNPPASGIAIGFAVEINGDGSAITWPSSVKWDLGTAPTATASKEVYTFITTDGGTTYYGKKAAGDIA